MPRKILVLNGPNLNRLGLRQPEIYGATTLVELEAMCHDRGAAHGFEVSCAQTNDEAAMLGLIHDAIGTIDGIVINPAAWSHSSVALLDALHQFDGPVIEVHISNIHKREAFRHHSYVSTRADGVIAGCGVQGYLLAIDRLAVMLGA